MDVWDVIKGLVDAQVRAECHSRGQMTVGDMKRFLRDVSADLSISVVNHPEISISSVGSYRGYYDHMALFYDTGRALTSKELLMAIESTTVMYGWKGGEFSVEDGTPLWVSRPSEASDLALIRVEASEGELLLFVEEVE